MPEKSHMCRWKVWVIVLALGLLAGAPAARPALGAAPALAGGLTLTGRVGFDNYYKDGLWTPVRVTVANDGPDVNGTLQVRVPVNGEETLYTRPVNLPTQSRREFFFYLPIQGYLTTSTLKIDLVSGTQLLASANLRLTQATTNDYIYGVLASAPSAFNALGNIDPLYGQGYVAQLEAGDLPPVAAGWAGLDVLVLADVDTGVFSPEQRQALADWVNGGGQLVVMGGAGWQKTTAGLAPLLPLAPTGTQTVTDLRPLGDFSGTAAPAGPAVAAVGARAPEAVTLVTTENLPAVTYRQQGFGRVSLVAFDPTLAPLKNWAGLEGLFRGLLTIPTDRPSWSHGLINWSSAEDAAQTVPGLVVPAAWQVCGFLGIYVIIIGPLNYLILRRLKRRSWAWFTIPAIVLVFSAAAYITGYGLRGTQAILHRLAVVEVWPQAEHARVQQIVGLFSPQRTKYAVTFEEGALARPLPYSGGLPDLGRLEVEQGSQTRLLAVQTEIGAVQTFVAEGQTPAPRFDAQLTLGFSNAIAGNSLVLAGEITNRSDLQLANAVLLAPGNYQPLGDITPGQTVQIAALPLTQSQAVPAPASPVSVLGGSPLLKLPPGYSADTTYTDILSIAYPTNEEEFRRSALLSAVLDQYSGGSRGQGVYLVGWTSTAPLDVSVPTAFRTLDLSVYFIALPYTLDRQAGPVELTPGMFTWSALDVNSQTNYSPYDIYLDPNVEVGFEFAPGPQLPGLTAQALTLHLFGYSVSGAASEVRVQLWDFSENTWVSQPNLVWGDNRITAPARFVGPQNNILVRLRNASNFTLNVTQIDFSLEAEQ